eukprot:424206-Prorocentrum_minimum.AAC.1
MGVSRALRVTKASWADGRTTGRLCFFEVGANTRRGGRRASVEPELAQPRGLPGTQIDGPIGRRTHEYILTMDQSDAGRTGIFSRWTNRTQDARVYPHDGPITTWELRVALSALLSLLVCCCCCSCCCLVLEETRPSEMRLRRS